MNYRFITSISILGTELFRTDFEFSIFKVDELLNKSKEKIEDEKFSDNPNYPNNLSEDQDKYDSENFGVEII